MAKTKTVKKVVKKKIKKPVEVPIEKKIYTIYLSFNDTTISTETNDISESLSEIDPLKIKTRVLIRIEKDNKVYQKLMNAFMARQIFRNKLYRSIFTSRIIFK